MTTRREENFRAEPNGTVLGRVVEEVSMTYGEGEGDWIRATLEGWLWTRSLRVINRQGFTLVVDSRGGENLRDAPGGRILARLAEGTLLGELERIPGWIRVERSGWVWGPSLHDGGVPSFGNSEDDTPAPPPSAPAPAVPEVRALSPISSTPVLTDPDGDTLAMTYPGAELRVMAREGSWVRVQIEGWAWLPEGTESPADSVVLSGLTPRDISDRGARLRGRIVALDLQFISLERAEPVRSDFYEGEPFLLMREPGEEGSFIYVAVPPDRLGEVEGISPLERMSVVGRVRRSAASLTGSPILDLIEFRRGR